MYQPNYLLMTAGPTTVRENVLMARSQNFGNPDFDEDFFLFYDKLTKKVADLLNAKKSTTIIMNGEGMLGLDSACASLTENGDEVLVIGNGVFGDGFGGLITPYGGKVTAFKGDWKNPISTHELDEFIKNSGKKFKYATVVHCDTPSGMLNDIKSICKVLKKHNILSVVDSVAAMIGVELDVDNWEIDIVLGASQKVFSAPPGLTIMTVSEKAWDIILKRKSQIPSFYCNLSYWKNCVQEKLFPYSLPASCLMGFDVAVNNVINYGLDNLINKHEEVANYTRERLKKIGLELYSDKGHSPTVTAFLVPHGFSTSEVIEELKTKYNIMISGSFGDLAEKVLRIGHMGENIFENRVEQTLDALEKIFKK
ncbi:MAG: pyridoxal-phosphate-dependent aminotransferase family protein [Fusobacteriaceae bacterium]